MEDHPMKANTILETIGNTPHVRINRLFAERKVEVWMKLERANPGGSIKDRIGLAMIEDAEQRGLLKPIPSLSNRPPATPASVWRWSPPPRAIA
jgi:hypothetical protein